MTTSTERQKEEEITTLLFYCLSYLQKFKTINYLRIYMEWKILLAKLLSSVLHTLQCSHNILGRGNVELFVDYSSF